MQYESDSTMQVHDILIKNGVISASVLENGDSRDCTWVSETDWIYRCSFSAPEGAGRKFLHCSGLDTVCDLYLNGVYLGSSKSMYLPFRSDITDILGNCNELLIYFHRHQKILDHYKNTMPDEWKGNVPAEAMFRKSSDYGKRAKDQHGYSPIGIFDRVCVETVECARLSVSDIEVTLNTLLDDARVDFSLSGEYYDGSVLTAEITVSGEDETDVIRT
jgi:beta-mannosidase